jgi:hypothetical protein
LRRFGTRTWFARGPPRRESVSAKQSQSAIRLPDKSVTRLPDKLAGLQLEALNPKQKVLRTFTFYTKFHIFLHLFTDSCHLLLISLFFAPISLGFIAETQKTNPISVLTAETAETGERRYGKDMCLVKQTQFPPKGVE